jgi:predicted site-specific integrase-resolvase
MSKFKVPENFYNVDEFCHALSISRSTFWKVKKMGLIKTIKIFNKVAIPYAEVQRILQEGVTYPNKSKAA